MHCLSYVYDLNLLIKQIWLKLEQRLTGVASGRSKYRSQALVNVPTCPSSQHVEGKQVGYTSTTSTVTQENLQVGDYGWLPLDA
jgi:hypothetical protein